MASVGANYGLELHWSKFQLLPVNGQYTLRAPDGSVISPCDVMNYLGASIYADGCVKSELNRKLGAAWGDFAKLNRLWKHTTLTKHRKVEVFQAFIVSRLLYGLSSAWLNVAEMRRLSGFQCRCLRVILRIAPAYVSRISNAKVLAEACSNSSCFCLEGLHAHLLPTQFVESPSRTICMQSPRILCGDVDGPGMSGQSCCTGRLRRCVPTLLMSFIICESGEVWSTDIV